MDERLTFEEVLRRDGRLVYTNVGVSMLPLLRENKDIMVIESDTSVLKKYDCVLFRRNGVNGRGRYVLHRILKILPDNKYFIVGDNCISGEIVEDKQIIGKLTSVIQGEKKVDFSSFSYKLYLYLWCAPYRLRFIVLRAKAFIKYIFAAIRFKIFGK